MGAGPIGLVTMLAARAFGVSKIVVADVDEIRLAIAKDLGATAVIKSSQNMEVGTINSHFVIVTLAH